MGKINVIYTPHVIAYLDELVRVLYKEEYFGFIDSAEDYVVRIYDAVSENIKLSSHKRTPTKLQYLGVLIIFFINQIPEPLGIFSLKKELMII